MRTVLERWLFPAVVCVTGGCVLVVEVVAVRVLSPYYGNTMFSVSSVISVILAALSIGYYAGGVMADRRPTYSWFFGLIFSSGVMLALFYALGVALLPVISERTSFMTGPLLAALLLFFLPALVLGMLSPYAVKLQSLRMVDQGVGTVSGVIFFWSTFGSISGSLLAGFFFIPRFGVDRIFIGTALVLVVLGGIALALLQFGRRRIAWLALVVGVLVSGLVYLARPASAAYVYEKDGIYERIRIYDVVDGDRPIRYFQQDRSESGGMYLDTKDPLDLVYGYTRYYALYKLLGFTPERVLVIGGGAYSVPKAFHGALREARIDIVEIEPSLKTLADQYFFSPRNTDDSALYGRWPTVFTTI